MRHFLCRPAIIWGILSFVMISCSSTNKEQVIESDLPHEGKEIVVIDYPFHTVSRICPEYATQHRSIPEGIRKEIMDAYLRAYSHLRVDGKDWEKYKRTISYTRHCLEKVGYCREMQEKGYMPTHCHPYETWILFETKYYPCMCLDMYQTLRNNPSYLNGVGLKGFSRILTYDYQYYTECKRAVCSFPKHFLTEIGIHSMEALPINEREKLSEEAKSRYKKELRRIYYIDQDVISRSSSE